MAEGALHDFEGWLVFMLSTGALVLTATGLARVGGSRTSWREAFDLGRTAVSEEGRVAKIERHSPVTSPSAVASAAHTTSFLGSVPRPFLAAATLVFIGASAAVATPTPAVYSPARAVFDEFPERIGEWTGRRQSLEAVYLNKLRLDDYVLSDYVDGRGAAVNFYAAYYKIQDATREVHSPHDCIPGGGWQIRELERRTFPAVGGSSAFPMNRAIIQLGSNRSIVYYWFQERDRRLTNEYVVRWYLFWDALTRHRTDGALVRFVAPYPTGVNESEVDAKIMSLATEVVPKLRRYIPD
jgi:EpsI family protein